MEAVPDTSPKPIPLGQLPAVLSARFAMTWQQFAVCAGFVMVYLLMSYLPLFQAITWRHVQSGNWIVAHRSLPSVDPALPLSDGFRFVTTSWLSDVMFSQIWRQAGLQGVSSALALVVIGLLVLTFTVFQLRTGRKRLALAATVLVFALHWPRLSILRPELLGLICFTALLLLISVGNESQAWRSRRMWLGAPGLFLLWANLDGSVVLGVMVLTGLVVARLTDALRETRSVWVALRDERFHRAIYLAEIAAVISLLQPAGIDLWIDLFQNSHSSVWWALGGYSPLILATAAGWTIVGVWVMGSALLRFSDRPILASDVVLILLASVAVIHNRSLTIWSAPLMLFVLLPHLANAVERRSLFGAKASRRAFVDGEAVPPLAFAFTMLSLLAVWCGFALSPLADPLLGGRPRAPQRIVAKNTPVALSQFFQQQKLAPAGLVWVPEDWGDWLSLNGPVGLQVSANSHLHLLTDRQKFDIVSVSRGEGNWTKTLDRYGVEWLVVDKQRQPRLMEVALTEGKDWSISYEDAQALVLRRKT